MSLYFVKGKGWRYDFTQNGKRYTKTWFKTKREAKQAEAKRKEEVQNPEQQISTEVTQTDMDFLELFNFGKNLKIIEDNPADAIKFLPVVKNKKYVPPKEDVYKVINAADPDSQDYLWAMVLTGARMGEINSLTWEDVNLEQRFVTLWTNKRKHGNKESRDIPMLQKLHEILLRRYEARDKSKPWVFWHRYWSRKNNEFIEGPFIERNRLMESLCKKASVKYFRFHSFRHFTASILDDIGTPIGVIQRILGHSNRRTTEGYLHSIGEAERNAMEKLGNLDLYSATTCEASNHPTNMHKEYWLRKADRPTYKVLCSEIDQLGYVGTGKKYGVSDNAIRKWKQHYEKSESLT